MPFAFPAEDGANIPVRTIADMKKLVSVRQSVNRDKHDKQHKNRYL